MPRNISSAALAKIATKQGIEPVLVIDVQWTAGGAINSYADKDIGVTGVSAAIQDVGGIDDIVAVSLNNQSQKVTVVLNDTDGTIKNIIDNNDIHLRPCSIYQWFTGLAYPTDRFLIFRGQINTPIVWNEGDRTVSFDVISQIEDIEVGFSIEEGDFLSPPRDAVGKAWPLVFGQCINVPALMLTTPRRGFLTTGVGIADPTLPGRIGCSPLCPYVFMGYVGSGGLGGVGQTLTGTYGPDPSCVQQNCSARANLQTEYDTQKLFEYPTITVYTPDPLNQFPQGRVLTLDINGAKFTGFFTGMVFTIQSRLHPLLAHPPVIGPVNVIGGHLEPQGSVVLVELNGAQIQGTFHGDIFTPLQNPAAPFRTPPGGIPTVTNLIVVTKTLVCQIPPSNTDFNQFDSFIQGFTQAAIDLVQGTNPGPSASQVAASHIKCQQLPSGSFYWANQGSLVTLDSDQEIIYIANLIPSAVLSVLAIKNYPTGPQLVVVPPDYYFVQNTNYVGYTGITEIHFPIQLSVIDPTWTDQVFVTQISSVGPNTVDILEYLISTYTAHSIDSVSFNHVRSVIDNYPMHFPLLERKPTLQVLQEIAYQARCALFLRDDTFYIIYLAETPTPVDTITKSDIDSNTMVLAHTPTEEIITQYEATWIVDHSNPNPLLMVLRHNVKKYGTLKQGFDFGIKTTKFDYYTYNIQDLVLKSSTFWLIRKCEVWRLISFRTPLHKLNIEVFDAVTIDIDHLAPAPVLCICRKASYNSAENAIDFEFWTPLRSGETTPYVFAWPAGADPAIIYPTINERFQGFAGSSLGPNFITRPPVTSTLSPQGGGGGSGGLACNGQVVTTGDDGQEHCENDYGRQKPSDRNDTKPAPPPANGSPTDTSGEISTGQGSNVPVPNCCVQAQNTANQALAAARAAQADASSAANAASGNNKQDTPDPLSKLPPAQCIAPRKCTAIVVVTYSTVTRVELQDTSHGSQSTTPGVKGQAIGDAGRFSKCYQFNTIASQVAFFTQIMAQWRSEVDNFQQVVGQQMIIDAPDGFQGDFSGCQPPAAEGMIGFTNNQPH